jgi:hypothetical protein
MPMQNNNPMHEVNTSLQSTGVAGIDNAANPANRGIRREQNPYASQMHVGFVTESIAGGQSVLVVSAYYPSGIPCMQVSPLLASPAAGINESGLPPVGSKVLVFVENNSANVGIIIGVLPSVISGNIKQSVDRLSAGNDVSASSEKSHIQPVKSKDRKFFNASSRRPYDEFPGEKSFINEMGVGLALRKLMSVLYASELANISVGLLDDYVKINSMFFTHDHALGQSRMYNTNGMLNGEFIGTTYQCERFGKQEYGSGTEDNILSRLKLYVGHLAGGVQAFVTSPDASGGLFHCGIGDNGSLALRSASDIIIKRTDRIQVPNKLRDPYDKDSDGYEKAHVGKKPFIWAGDTGPARALQSRDFEKWFNKNMYSRFLALAGADGDFELEEEASVKLKDDYDTLEDSSEAFEDNQDKEVILMLRKDGGFLVRDSEGAEISLSDGKVIISAPEGIELRSGKSIISLAAEDFVCKAKESVDVSATNKDIRLKAEKNLHMHSGSNLMFDCAAEGAYLPGEGAEGEDVTAGGIIFNAEKSCVFCRSNLFHTSAENIHLETKESEVGSIKLVSKYYSGSHDSCRIVTGLTAGLVMSSYGSAVLAGKIATLAGGTSASVTRGNEAMVPVEWQQIGFSAYDTASGTFSTEYKYYTDDEWLAPLGPDDREGLKFTFRTAEQCGTSSFKIYESFWAYKQREDGSEDRWEENPVNDTYPWPGTSNYENDVLNTLAGEDNVENAKSGIAKPMEDVSNSGQGFKKTGMDSYIG